MKKGEFIHFAEKAFNLAESRHQDIGRLATSASDNPAHDFANKNESTDADVSCEVRYCE